MDKRTLAQDLLNQLGNTLTVGPLTLDERTRSCVLLFDGDLVINIEYDDSTERLVLASYLAELPATGAEPLLRELLAANLYWHRTRGATLGLEEGTGGILLTYAHAVSDLDGPKLEAVLHNFVHQAERWTTRIQDASRAPAATVGAVDPAPAGLPRVFG